MQDYDLCVIGGGINGAGIARDAAGRGLSVLLVEARDLASATSSASTKLIHGGLRYLEYYEFRLVRESLREREELLAAAPHIIRPMEFVLPHVPDTRSYWMIRTGLFLYDHLGPRKRLPGSRGLDLKTHPYGRPLKPDFNKGFSYADCWAEDARLVVLNAMDAAQKGAAILTHTACTKLEPQEDHWRVHLHDFKADEKKDVRAGMVVNATGPWVRGLLEQSGLAQDDEALPGIRMVKGSHIVVPRAFEGRQAYVLQQNDGRIVFVIPFEHKFTLIGTTEENYRGDPEQAGISQAETDYLCRAFNNAFEQQIAPGDIVWSYSGVRPLFDDGEESATSVTRDYRLYEHAQSAAPMISVFGGKLTTYRKLAEQVMNRLMALTGRRGDRWTEGMPLPGGDIPDGDFGGFVKAQADIYPFLPEALLHRYAQSYGTCMDQFLRGATAPDDLGRHFGDDVYESEIRYLVREEWARAAEDILWRRSKLGLHVSPETAHNLEHALPGIVLQGAAP